jgi:hypothetical protein
VYESRDLVGRLLTERHGRAPNHGKCEEVASFLAHARQFFISAQDADDLVRPLLLYYGVLSLTRLVVLASDVELRESALTAGHGVELEGWRETLAQDGGGIAKVPDLRLRVRGGTLSELARATQNIERSLVFSAPMPAQVQLVVPGARAFPTADGQQVMLTLGDLWDRMPDLQALVERALGHRAKAYPATVFMLSWTTHTDFEVLPTALGLPEETELRESLSLPSNVAVRHSTFVNEATLRTAVVQMARLGEGVLSVRWEHPDAALPYVHLIKTNVDGMTYLVSPLPGGMKLSTMSMLFLLAYTAGMFVRYYPTRWHDLVTRKKGDFTYPLFKAGLDLVERRFPELVLMEMESPPAA